MFQFLDLLETGLTHQVGRSLVLFGSVWALWLRCRSELLNLPISLLSKSFLFFNIANLL